MSLDLWYLYQEAKKERDAARATASWCAAAAFWLAIALILVLVW